MRISDYPGTFTSQEVRLGPRPGSENADVTPIHPNIMARKKMKILLSFSAAYLDKFLISL